MGLSAQRRGLGRARVIDLFCDFGYAMPNIKATVRQQSAAGNMLVARDA
jgi:hypothetical protein